MNDYGKKIAALRKNKGMTQEELGKVLNVTYQAVSKWERGESMPDFMTMSQIAKFFQVPLNYFEDGAQEQQVASDVVEKSETTDSVDVTKYIGICTVCGKMLEEGNEAQTSPKIVCKECFERKQEEERRLKQEREKQAVAAAREQERRVAVEKQERERAEQERRKKALGKGFDVKLVVSLAFAAVAYILFTILCFTCDRSDREFYSVVLLIAPLAIFGWVISIADFISELRDKEGDDDDGYKLTLSLIIAAVFAVINFVLYLVLYMTSEQFGFYLVLLVIGVIVSFMFVSQYLWGSVVRELFTFYGFSFKLPGVIFSLDFDSILWMIVTKLLLGILAIVVFVVTSILSAVITMLGSVLTFIPCIITKVVKDKRA
ncbi:MAG: helix-turn-helix domain-containing protein [Clostridia bacterium]|nr:helix-turn-helix domain-containing protein [Clostridia bacterium]